MQPTHLIPHPEGGCYQEVFRSTRCITNDQGHNRSALTHIYFALQKGEVSRFHRVNSDEIWNLYQGDQLDLYLWDGLPSHPPEHIVLSAKDNAFCHVVPAGVWQAAEAIASDLLVGCSVAPGFEFCDFQMIDAAHEAHQRLIALAPALQRFY
ncbi:MAG: cupin domain-containing protein [Zetaproteobacteria bacterium]|nr:cupin domain-containing protein [Zetaproteobacteria bacterium]